WGYEGGRVWTSGAKIGRSPDGASASTSPVSRCARPVASQTSERAKPSRAAPRSWPVWVSCDALHTELIVCAEREFRPQAPALVADRAQESARHRYPAEASQMPAGEYRETDLKRCTSFGVPLSPRCLFPYCPDLKGSCPGLWSSCNPVLCPTAKNGIKSCIFLPSGYDVCTEC